MFAKTSILALAATAALLPAALAQVSDDFESGWSNDTWPVYAPDCTGGGTVTLDSTTAHSGKNSMKVVGGSNGYCGHVFFGTTKVPTGGDVYVRTWLKHSTALSDSHVTFIVMPDTGLDGKHLRVSGQEEIIEYNRESDDATLPDLSPNGVASTVGLPTDEWQCFEYHLGSDGTIETWLNSKAVTGLSAGPGSTNTNDNGWGTSYKPDITGVYFGWESYAGSVDTFWYDDVAIASTRVGCSPAGGSASTGIASASSTAAAVSSTVLASTAKATTSSAAPATSSAVVSPVKATPSSSVVKASTPASSTRLTSTSTSATPSSSAVASLSSVAPPSSVSSSAVVHPISTSAVSSTAPLASTTLSATLSAPAATSAPATSAYSTGLPSSSSKEDCVINYVTVYV